MPSPHSDSPTAQAPTAAPAVSFKMLALLLGGLSMLGPFAIDTYLPAFGNIQSSLHASQIEVQQTLTSYVLAFSVMTLWHGALSDAFGRRRIILITLALFAVATLGCAASPNCIVVVF
jgi:DHA1 family bicyclomycin/chloramphenicol resistance-like MFS transporter